jgi:NAD-dependent DNA ligase
MAGGAKAIKKDRDRAAFLREAINLHNERYFAHDAPEISDAEYDELKRDVCASYTPRTNDQP